MYAPESIALNLKPNIHEPEAKIHDQPKVLQISSPSGTCMIMTRACIFIDISPPMLEVVKLLHSVVEEVNIRYTILSPLECC